MFPLDFPSTYAADESLPGMGHPDAAAAAAGSTSLSAHCLERYLSEEHNHERFALGVPPSGANKATVRRYLPDILENTDSNASPAEATRGTTVGGDGRACRESIIRSRSTSSDGSLGLVKAHDCVDPLTEAAAASLARTTCSSKQDMTPRLAGLSQTHLTPLTEHALAGESPHQVGVDTFQEELEMEQALYVYVGFSTCVVQY